MANDLTHQPCYDERSFGAEYSGPRRVVGGLAVTTLGSGKLYLYLA